MNNNKNSSIFIIDRKSGNEEKRRDNIVPDDLKKDLSRFRLKLSRDSKSKS